MTCRIGRRLGRSESTTIQPLSYREAARPWDVVVLSARPGEVDDDVLDFARIHAQVIASMSQVPGDLDVLAHRAPGSKVALVVPTFFASTCGRSPMVVDVFAPGRTAFEVASHDDETATFVVGSFGTAARAVPVRSVLMRAARTMPYMAELVVQGGDWNTLLRNLRRPGIAAAEAASAIDGDAHRRVSDAVAWTALRSLAATAPFDFPRYARTHFIRHSGQTLDMLDTWSALDTESHPMLDALRADLRTARGGSVV